MKPIANCATLAAGLALAAHALSASAHAFLDHADPRVGSTVAQSPAQVTVWFTEKLEPAFSTLKVQDASGKDVDAHDGKVIRRRCEQFVRLVEAAQFMQSQRSQRAAMRAREFVADDQGQVERLCDRFDPADQIDAWPDNGEIEPVGRADIAVKHGAVVQRNHHLERLAA